MSLDLQTIGLAMETKGLEKGTKALGDNEKAAHQAADAADKVSSGFLKMGNSTQLLVMGAKALGSAFATWKIYDQVRDMVMLSARFETMGIVMGIAGNNAGYTRKEMDELATALQKSGISMLQSRNSITQLATANIDLAQAAKLGRAAQDLAVVGNTNSSEALGRMIYGIKSGQKEILATLGLNVSFEGSYKKLAATLGVTTEALTEDQKVLARTQATLSEAARYTGIYEESMTTAGKAMTSLTRYWEDMKIKMGDAFLPTLSTFVFKLTDALKAMNGELDAAGQSGVITSIGEALNGTFKTALETVAVLGANVAFVLKVLGLEIGGFFARLASLAKGESNDFRQNISKAVEEDTKAAAKALTDFENKILKTGEVTKAVATMTEAERIAAGKASKEAKDAADAKAVADAKAAEWTKKVTGEYESLRNSIHLKVVEQEAERMGGDKLTESDKLRIKFTEDLGTKLKGLSVARQVEIDSMLETLRVNEELVAQTKRNMDEAQRDLELQQEIEELNRKRADSVNQIALAYDRAKSSAEDFLETLRLQQSRELGAMGEGSASRSRIAGRQQIEDRYSQQRRDLERSRRDAEFGGTFDDVARQKYDGELELLKQYQGTALSEYDAFYAARLEKEQDWSLGAKRAMQDYADEARNIFKQTEDMFKKAMQGMEDAITTFVQTGKLDFTSLIDSMLADLIRMQISKPVSSALFNAVGMAMSGGGGADTTFAGYFAEGGDSAGGYRVVGEKGPELEATGPSRIFNAEQTKNILSGGSTQAIQVHYAPVFQIEARTDRAVIQQDVARISEATMHRMVDRLTRAGKIGA